jgi:branched-chain amino acid transport system substrate-binding protein
MKKSAYVVLMAILASILFWTDANAQSKDAAPACPKELISVATGITGGTYSNMFKPIKNLPGANELVCEYQKTGGGYDNVLLLMDRKVDAGIIQSDVFDFLNKTNPDIRKKLRNLFAMHGSSMHIFVLRDGTKTRVTVPGKVYGTNTEESMVRIETLRDLKGRKVAAFSSAVVTGTIISQTLNLNLEIVETSKNEGLEKLKKGEVFAFLAMGGKPIEWMSEVDEKVITLANVETSDIQALGAPYYNTKLQYKKFNAIGTNAITARNDLVVWDYAGKKAGMLLKLRDLVRDNLADIKEDMDAHPCWQEVTEENFLEVFWQKYAPSMKDEQPATAKPTTQKK